MGALKNTVALLAVEAFAVFILYFVAKYAFGINILDFSTPRGHLIGLGLSLLFLYTFYNTLFEPGAITSVGAQARYGPSDERRTLATSPVKPMLF